MPDSSDILDIETPLLIEGGIAWLWIAVALGALLLVAAFLRHHLQRRPALPPPTPREIALNALRDLAACAHEAESICFAAEVSEVLRRFIGAQFGLRAEYQTTPEFLATARRSMIFSRAETELLAEFLSKADNLKFGGHPPAPSMPINTRLLDLAMAFVRGGAP